VDVVTLTLEDGDLRVLLIRRRKPPFEGKWALPGGFVGMDESLREAALRELAEETDVRDVCLEQIQTFGDLDRDPRGRVITVAYLALVAPHAVSARAGDDALETRWWSMYDLPPLAFDHADILACALRKLRCRPECTPLICELLPEVFTLTELQSAYESILDQKLDRTAFRRRVLGLEAIEETGDSRIEEGRLVKLYRVREEPAAGCTLDKFPRRAYTLRELYLVDRSKGKNDEQ
jgi:8-oxo-dGTP diphosphatase